MPGVRLLRIECERCARLVARERRAAAHQLELNNSSAGSAAALPLTLDMARRTLNHALRGGWRAWRSFTQRAAEQRHAPDREERGFHPSARRLVTMCARRVMPGVRLLRIFWAEHLIMGHV